MRGRPHFRVMPEGQPVLRPASRPAAVSGQPDVARRSAPPRSAPRTVDPARTSDHLRAAAALAMETCATAARADAARAAPSRSCRSRRRSIADWAPTAVPPPPADAGVVPIEPIMAAPKFPQPMYEPLRDLSQELLLPGLETVVPNSVLGLKTNRRFVEAYMVGLNFEMGRELLWRGYPDRPARHVLRRSSGTRAAATRRGRTSLPMHDGATAPLGDPADGAGARAVRDADAQRRCCAAIRPRSIYAVEGGHAERRARAEQRRRTTRCIRRFAARCSRTSRSSASI